MIITTTKTMGSLKKDDDKNILNKKYTDREIIDLIQKQIKNNTEEYVEKRKYKCLDIRGKYTIIQLKPIKEIEKEAIKKYLEKEAKIINIDSYFDFFTQIGFENCKEWILIFCGNLHIVDRLNDEQVISIYKEFSDECRRDSRLNYVSERLRKLLQKNKFSDVINKNDEVLRSFKDQESFVYPLELSFDCEDLNYIISNIDFNQCEDLCFASNKISVFLEKNKELVDNEMKKTLFNKLQSLEDYAFLEAICGDTEDCEFLNFNYKTILNENQIDDIWIRIYNIMSHEYNLEGKEMIAKEVQKTCDKKIKMLIVNEIIKDIISIESDSEDFYKLMEIIYLYLSQDKPVFSKETLQEIFVQMKKNSKFLYGILDNSSCLCSYGFDFIKKNIIDEIGEEKIAQLLDENLDLNLKNHAGTLPTVKKEFEMISTTIENIAKQLYKDNKNQEQTESVCTIKEVLNKVFDNRDRDDKAAEHQQLSKYFYNKNLFECLYDKNKDEVLNYFLIKNGKISLSIIEQFLKNQKFVSEKLEYIWKHWLNDDNTEVRFYIIHVITNMLQNNKSFELEEHLNNAFNIYADANKSDFIKFVLKKFSDSWNDLEVSYICTLESLDTIGIYLKDLDRFTDQQWNKIFTNFYKIDYNIFIPFDRFNLNYEEEVYLDFDEQYKNIIKKYRDADLIDVKDSEMNTIIKKVKKRKDEIKAFPF